MSRGSFSRAALELARVGISQRQLGDALGVSDAYVSLMLSGRRRLRPELCVAIAALGGRELARQIAEILEQHPESAA